MDVPQDTAEERNWRDHPDTLIVFLQQELNTLGTEYENHDTRVRRAIGQRETSRATSDRAYVVDQLVTLRRIFTELKNRRYIRHCCRTLREDYNLHLRSEYLQATPIVLSTGPTPSPLMIADIQRTTSEGGLGLRHLYDMQQEHRTAYFERLPHDPSRAVVARTQRSVSPSRRNDFQHNHTTNRRSHGRSNSSDRTPVRNRGERSSAEPGM